MYLNIPADTVYTYTELVTLYSKKISTVRRIHLVHTLSGSPIAFLLIILSESLDQEEACVQYCTQ